MQNKPKYPANIPESVGDAIIEVINRPESLIKMDAMCRAQLPAVQGIEEELAEVCGEWIKDHGVKQFAGNQVKRFLVGKGYEQMTRKHTSTRKVFSQGTWYHVPEKVKAIVYLPEGWSSWPKSMVLAIGKLKELGVQLVLVTDVTRKNPESSIC